MHQVKIRPIKVRHVPALRRKFVMAARSSFNYLPPRHLEEICHQNRISQLLIGRFHPRRLIYVATSGDNLVGYAIGSVEGDSSNLYWLYVDAEARGQAVGLKLISALRRAAQQRGAKNLALSTYDQQSYYERQGFKPVDTRTMYELEMKIMKLTF